MKYFKRQRIPKGKSKLDNPEKSDNIGHTTPRKTQHVLDITTRKTNTNNVNKTYENQHQYIINIAERQVKLTR